MAHPIFQANENSPYGDLSKEEFYKKHKILHQESFMINNHNMKIFTQSWILDHGEASPSPLKGLVAMIHGFTLESSWISELNAVAIAKAGFFVCALDLQGHGFSQGPRDYIPDIEPLIHDCIQFFDSSRSQHKNLPAFLYGESLGGAIGMFVCLRQRKEWNGLILSGPMCGISKKYKPMWPLEKLLPIVAYVVPKWRIMLMEPPTTRSYKEDWKSKLVSRNPNRRCPGKPPAATAQEFMNICESVKKRCHELEVPLLILHGGCDVICDPEATRFVFESAASKDKTLKIFPGMWHQLIGEPNEDVELVFNTMISWIQVRADLS